MHKHDHPSQQTHTPHTTVVVTNPAPVNNHPHHHQHPMNGGAPQYQPTQPNYYQNPHVFFQPAPHHVPVSNPAHHPGHTGGGTTHGHG